MSDPLIPRKNVLDRIAGGIIEAAADLELARRQSCSQKARITNALEKLKTAYNETMAAPSFEYAIEAEIRRREEAEKGTT